MQSEHKNYADASICSIFTLVVIGFTFSSPFILIPKNSEFTGAAAIILLAFAGGAFVSVILCICAFCRKERLAWFSLLGIIGSFLFVAARVNL